jgi:Ca2+-dependent lipid-binding protein
VGCGWLATAVTAMAAGVVAVHLRVISAADLPKTDMFGSIDPYVKIFYEDAELGCTSTLINEPNPTWEEVRQHNCHAACGPGPGSSRQLL